MERFSFGTGSTSYTGSDIHNLTESDVKTIFATLFGYDQSNLKVTFKDMDGLDLIRTHENLLFGGTASTGEDVHGSIIIELIPEDIWHYSEISARYSSSGTHPYDRTIPIMGRKIILDRNTCMDTYYGGGVYRNVFPLNYCDRYCGINIESTNANDKDIFYISHGSGDPARSPLDPPTEYHGGGAEQTIISGTSDAAGRALFNQGAKGLGFLFGQVYPTSDSEHGVRLSWCEGVPDPSLYFKGFILAFKTEVPHSKVKFVAAGGATSDNIYMESDYSGQIIFSRTRASNGIGYLAGLKEINISMQAECCYQGDGQGLEDNDVIPLQLASAKTVIESPSKLPNRGDSIQASDIIGYQGVSDANRQGMSSVGGMVTLNNYEITKNNTDRRALRGYSYVPTRQEHQVISGNFVYDHDIVTEKTSSNNPPLNKSGKFNFNTGGIPIIIYSNGDAVGSMGKICNRYAIDDTAKTVGVEYVDGSSNTFLLRNEDKLVKYTRPPGTIASITPSGKGLGFDSGSYNTHLLHTEGDGSGTINVGLSYDISIKERDISGEGVTPSATNLEMYRGILENKTLNMSTSAGSVYGDYAHNDGSTAGLGNLKHSIKGPSTDVWTKGYSSHTWSFTGTFPHFKGLTIKPTVTLNSSTDGHSSSFTSSDGYTYVTLSGGGGNFTVSRHGILPQSFKMGNCSYLSNVYFRNEYYNLGEKGIEGSNGDPGEGSTYTYMGMRYYISSAQIEYNYFYREHGQGGQDIHRDFKATLVDVFSSTVTNGGGDGVGLVLGRRA